MSDRIEAVRIVEEACQELGIRLADLIAMTSFWIHPHIVAQAAGPRYPNRRRANLGLRKEGKQLEFVGQVIDGIILDNNTYANNAFKQALGIRRADFIGFHVCHIWPGTVYDPACFTHLANLVGIPADLSSLTDHHPHIAACLKYRAWELYQWRPEAEKLPPVKPADYPVCWREPMSPKPFGSSQLTRHSPDADEVVSGSWLEPETGLMPSSERSDVVARIRRWASKPSTNVYKLIGLIVSNPAGFSRQQLVARAEDVVGSKNAYGAVSSLLTSAGNAYGRVLIELDGRIYLHPDIKDEVLSHSWD